MACRWIRGVINVLRPGKMLPQDCMVIAFNILKTASSADFVWTMRTNQALILHRFIPVTTSKPSLARPRVST